MLDKKRNDVIKIHQKLSKTLKDLKSFLPSGFIKINIISSRISPIRHKRTLINVERAKQIDSPNSRESMKTQSKNEYIFSDNKNNLKRKNSKLKNYFNSKKQKSKLNYFNNDNRNKIETIKNNSNFIDIDYNNHRERKTFIKNKIKNEFLSRKNLNDKKIPKTNSDFKYVKLNYQFNQLRKNFQSSSIDNSIMKNNICLPSITERLQTKLPRYDRESSGLLVENFRFNDNKNFHRIRFNKSFNVNIKANNNISENKKIHFNDHNFNKLKNKVPVKINSIKKLKKEEN